MIFLWNLPFELGLVEVSCERGHANVAPIFERGQKCNPGNHRLYKLALGRSGPSMRGLLSDISGHLKEKNVSKSRQHGLTNSNSCLSKAVVTVRKALRFSVTMEVKSDVHIVRAAAAFLCCSRLCGSDAGLLDRYPQTALIISFASPFIPFSLFSHLSSPTL